MKESVIKGTGNSRYLKSSLEGITTWEQFRDALAAGTLPVDLNGINPEGFQQLGDPLNKVTLLKDATAGLYGKDNTAVPDDMYQHLSAATLWTNSRLRTARILDSWKLSTEEIEGFTGPLFANKKFFFMKNDDASGTLTKYSDGAENWKTFSVPVGYTDWVAYGNGVYVIPRYLNGGKEPKILVSSDLATWQSVSVPSAFTRGIFCESLKMFVATGTRDNTVYYSENGLNWKGIVAPNGIATSNRTIINDNDGAVIFGQVNASNFSIYKFDGSQLVSVFNRAVTPSMPSPSNVGLFCKFKGKYYLFDSGYVAKSENLTSWNVEKIPITNGIKTRYGISTDEFVLLETDNYNPPTLCYTNDGENFELIYADDWPNGPLAYNGDMIMTTCTSSGQRKIMYTEDEYIPFVGLTNILGKALEISFKQIVDFQSIIHAGSYVGTGGYGESSPTTLICGFNPKALIVVSGTQLIASPVDLNAQIPCPSVTGGSQTASTVQVQGIKYGVKFWSLSNAFYQLNTQGTKYYYVAIG